MKTRAKQALLLNGKGETGSHWFFSCLQQLGFWPKAAWAMVAPPLCGTLLLSPSLLLSFESWCSVELLPETGPAAEAAALQREEERGRTSKAFSKLPSTAATQTIPPPSASSKTLSSVNSHYRERSAGSYHRIPVVTGQGTLPRANAREFAPSSSFCKRSNPPSPHPIPS